LKDFDFCKSCEETKSHPHAFLKIKRSEQAPQVLITAINDHMASIGPEQNNPAAYIQELMQM